MVISVYSAAEADAMLAEMRAQVSALTGRMSAVENAVFPPKPIFGVNNRQFGLVQAAAGVMAAERWYFGPASSFPASWPSSAPGVTMPVVSVKPDIPSTLSGSLEAKLTAWAKLIPPGAVVSGWHEGESNDGWTPDQIRAFQAYVAPRVKAIQPQCTYAQIVTCFSAKPIASQYPLTKWISDDPAVDAVLMDGYGRVATDSFASIFGPAVDQIRAANTTAQLGIAETNHREQASRPDWFTSAYAEAKAGRYLTFMPYWSPDATGGAYAWVAADTATAAVLATINADSRQAR